MFFAQVWEGFHTEILRMYCDSASVSMEGGYLLHSRTNAWETPNVNVVKNTFNLTLKLNLTLNLNVIPRKNNHK